MLSLLGMAVALPTAAQALALHGVAFSKGCVSPVAIGAAYTCGFGVQNSLVTDQPGDTLTFTSIVDIVHAAAGDQNSGNILSVLRVASLAGGATCNVSGTNTGPTATGNTLCTLPTGSSIIFQQISHYTVAANDPNPLTDTANLIWQDLCTSGANDCPVGNVAAQAASQATITGTPPPPPPPPSQIPTLSEWVMIMLAAFLVLVGGAALIRKRRIA